MKQIGSLMAMSLELAARVPEIAIELHLGLKKVAEKIEADARAEFGVYQDAIGPHPAWPELAESTKDQRVKLGYSENEPLLREGALRDSVTHEVQGLEAAIGSMDPVMAYQEFGTDRIPARPVLGPAGFKNREVIQKLVGAAALAGILGPVGATGPVLPSVVHADLGYNQTTED